MAEYVLCEKTTLDNIANSIRGKINSSDNMNIEDFSINVDNIPKGENVSVSYSNQYLKFYYTYFSETGELVNNIIDFLDQQTVHSDDILVAKNSIFIVQVSGSNSISNLIYSEFNKILSTDTVLLLEVIGDGNITQRSWGSTTPI